MRRTILRSVSSMVVGSLLVSCDSQPSSQVHLFTMSKCPFGAQVTGELVKALAPLGEQVQVQVSHLGSIEGSQATSLRGEPEVQGDLLQVCADDLGSADSRRRFLICQAEQFERIPANWEHCANEAKIDVSAMRSCAEGKQGLSLLKASFERAEHLHVQTSPTLYIGSTLYSGPRNHYAIAEAVCASFGGKSPEACGHLPAPPQVAIKVVTDARCSQGCDLAGFEQLLAQAVPGAKVEKLDWSSAEGKRLFAASKRSRLPIAVFPKGWKPSDALSKQIVEGLLPLAGGEETSFAIGTEFDPSGEICGNAVDDDGNGLTDCTDPRCSLGVACRQELKNRLDVFVLLGDEFSHRGVEAAHHVLTQEAFDVGVHPIGHVADGGLVATGGKSAVLEGVRLECAQAKGLKSDDVLQYAMCRQQRAADPNWQGCLPAEVDRDAIQACVTGPEGLQLLTAAYRTSEQLSIQKAPFLLVNNKHPLSEHAPSALRAGMCKYNEGRSSCARKGE